MPAACARFAVLALFAGCTLLAGPATAQQQLGHKILGTLGLHAATQPETGLYVADRLAYFHSSRLVDRHGERVPVSLDLNALANVVGVAGALKIPRLRTFINVAVGVPVAYLRVNLGRLQSGVDRLGLSDIYVQPLRLGWQVPHVDLGLGYAFYAPTGRLEVGGGGVSRGYWSHELSTGGTVYFDARRRWHLSVLGSYELNQRVRGLDITRGDSVQLQGGAGARMRELVELGLVGYAAWQVRDDRGADVPPALRGARFSAFGLGVEAGILVRAIRGRLFVRYSHDLTATARPFGQLLLAGVTVAAWSPRSALPSAVEPSGLDEAPRDKCAALQP